MINICLAYQNGVLCIYMAKDGYTIKKEYLKFKDENINSAFIAGLNKAVLLIREFINANGIPEVPVAIEMKNKAIIKWLRERRPVKQHEFEVMEFLTDFNRLPIVYEFVYSDKPIALRFIKQMPTKERTLELSSLDDLVKED